jgi:hypothetical protein
MHSAALDECAALDVMENRWRNLGYTLIREPSQDQLPDFLRGFRPDAIATGASPSLLIEVVNPRSRRAEVRIKQLQQLLSQQSDWKLEVVYAPSEIGSLHAVSGNVVRASLQSARRLLENDTQAALLLVWSALEAIARQKYPVLATRGLSPHRVMNMFLEEGSLSQAASGLVFRLANMRNALAHGQLDVRPSPQDVVAIIELAERLNEVPVQAPSA